MGRGDPEEACCMESIVTWWRVVDVGVMTGHCKFMVVYR